MISRERLCIANRKARRRVELMADNFDVFRDCDGNQITGKEWKEKVYVRYRKTTKRCSQACCGNPRKYFNEVTKQEIWSNNIFDEYLRSAYGL